MVNSMPASLLRVSLFWYILGLLILFLGKPSWLEDGYMMMQHYPWVPKDALDLDGIWTAAEVQRFMLWYWTIPLAVVVLLSLAVGAAIVEGVRQYSLAARRKRLRPRGSFWGVRIPGYSLGDLPIPTTPARGEREVLLPGSARKVQEGCWQPALSAEHAKVFAWLTPEERSLCEEILQLLFQQPEHFAGHGHGVGLLAHTLNVVSEALPHCTPEFRLPLMCALAHDIGKLITFQPDDKGGWKRKGLHSRESARILATLPGFQSLPENHRTALLLAVKYDHAPQKMPAIRGDSDTSRLAMRIIAATSKADQTATAAEKDRNLVKLQPEDLLWDDFCRAIFDAPVVQQGKGKTGVQNQINNADGPFLYLYEAPWRDAAVGRLPPEVAAALDLKHRSVGKLAKYTRILVERLRKENLLVEAVDDKKVPEDLPLWDIKSGTGEKAPTIRGVLIIRSADLWRVLNRRLGTKSPHPVEVLGATMAPVELPSERSDASAVGPKPKAKAQDKANTKADPEQKEPAVADGMKVSADELSFLGLKDKAPEAPTAPAGEVSSPELAPNTESVGESGSPANTNEAGAALPGLATHEEGAKSSSNPMRKRKFSSAPAKPVAIPGMEASPAVQPAAAAAEPAQQPAPTAELPPEAAPTPTEEPAPSVDPLQAAMAYVMQAAQDAPGIEGEERDVLAEGYEDPTVDAESHPETAAPAVVAENTSPSSAISAENTVGLPVTELPELALSATERGAGIAIATQADVARYPDSKLDVGDKFHPATSRAVKSGAVREGACFARRDPAKRKPQPEFSKAPKRPRIK